MMFEKTLARLALAACCAVVSASAWAASPSVDQVYQAARAGDYAQAQSMMDQVLREHPDSAQAHFVEAELLARQGKLAAARGEFETAQKINPSLSFAKPEAVQTLKTQLAGNGASRSTSGATVPAQIPNGGRQMAWGNIALIAVIVVLGVMFLRRTFGRRTFGRRANGYGPGAGNVLMPGGPAGPAGYGPGGAAMPPMGGMGGAGGMGSGIMGGLATGAAVGAGMVAGQALMNRVFDGGSHSNPAVTDAPVAPPPPAYDMGGNDFGLNDASSWDGGAGGGDSWDSGGGSDDWS